MMDFVILVAAFVVANLLCVSIAFAVMFNKKVVKWYYKKVLNLMKDMEEIAGEVLEAEEL